MLASTLRKRLLSPGAALGFATALLGVQTVAFFTDFPEPARVAWEQARAHDTVHRLVGEDAERSWWWEGRVAPHKASVTFEVRGSKGEGKVASKLLLDPDSGRWVAASLALVHSGRPHDLLYSVDKAQRERKLRESWEMEQAKSKAKTSSSS